MLRIVNSVKNATSFVQPAVRTAEAAKQQLRASIDSGEKYLENKVGQGRAWLSQHGGMVGQLVSNQIGLDEGICISLYNAGKGSVQLADGAASLANSREWAANPQANIARLQFTASTVETLGKLASLAIPQSWLADPQGNVKLASALWHDAAASLEKDPAKFAGNVIGTIGTMTILGTDAPALAGDVGPGARLVNGASKAETLADGSKVAQWKTAAKGIGTAKELGIPKFLSPRQELHISPVSDCQSVLTSNPATLLQGLQGGSFTILRQPKPGQVIVDFGKPIGE